MFIIDDPFRLPAIGKDKQTMEFELLPPLVKPGATEAGPSPVHKARNAGQQADESGRSNHEESTQGKPDRYKAKKSSKRNASIGGQGQERPHSNNLDIHRTANPRRAFKRLPGIDRKTVDRQTVDSIVEYQEERNKC